MAVSSPAYRDWAVNRRDRARVGEIRPGDFSYTEIARGISKLGGGGTAVRIYFMFLANMSILMWVLTAMAAPSIVVNSMGSGLSGALALALAA